MQYTGRITFINTMSLKDEKLKINRGWYNLFHKISDKKSFSKELVLLIDTIFTTSILILFS